jgi:hypothetical protein
VKQHAINEAIKRYQASIEQKTKTDEHLLVKHYDRVKHDVELNKFEHDLKRRKQEMFSRDLADQIRKDVSASTN